MTKYKIVEVTEIYRFLLDLLLKIGTKKSHAIDLVDLLVEADTRGHMSHGLNRVQLYLDDITQKSCRFDTEPQILKENNCTAWVDGNNLLGPVVGKFCMRLAIKKAKENGIGMVTCKGSNHFGINQYYALMATDENLIGLTFTNGSPLVAPSGGKNPFLSTNPIAVTANGKNDKLILDMATSAVALGKVEIQERKNEKIPLNWAIDINGKSIDDPSKLHALLPLGGLIETSGYKGYGLGIFVELFTSILSGATCSPSMRNWKEREKIANVGHCFIAIDPTCFAPNFEDRLDDLASKARNQTPLDSNNKVLFPGDPELKKKKLIEEEYKGIPYHESQINFADELAKKYQIEEIKVLKEIDILQN